MSASTLLTLLTSGADALKNNKRIHLIVGNEACDADSTIGALSLSLILAARGDINNLVIIVPVISCTRSDWILRREAGVIIKRWIGDNHDADLIFLDDILSTSNVTSITLVDHNELTGSLASFGWSDRVCSIVDHHEDIGAHLNVINRQIDWDTTSIPPRGCGSCCSLLARDASQLNLLDVPFSIALLSVIALDCIGFDTLAGKVTPIDIDAVEKLTAVIDASGPTLKELFNELSSLRSDQKWWLSIPPLDALRADYKGFTARGGLVIGTSALMISISKWLGTIGTSSSNERISALHEFAVKKGLDILVLFSLEGGGDVENTPSRQLAVCFYNSERGTAAMGAISNVFRQGGAGESWGLEEITPSPPTCSDDIKVKVYNQRDVRISRKQIAPRLIEALGNN